MLKFAAAALLCCLSVSAMAAEGLVVKPSNHSVSETIDRLQAILEEKGLTIFGRIDHQAGAATADLELRPTEVLIFGNPKLGTPLMTSAPTVAIDLPQKSDLLTAAFDAEPGIDALPINVDPNGYLFYDVVSVDPAHDRTLDAVRDGVVADWKRERAGEQLNERAAALQKEIDGGKSIEGVAKEAGVEARTAFGITRQSAVGELGRPGAEAAFSGPAGDVVTAPGREPETRLVMKVVEVSPPADPSSNVTAAQRQQMAGMLENDLYQSYVTLLQNEYPVRINPETLEQAKALAR